MPAKTIASILLVAVAAVLLVFWLRHRKESEALRRGFMEGYSADVTFTDLRDESKSYRGRIVANVLTTPRGVRYEYVFADRRRVTVWRQDRNRHWVLDPESKTYWEPKVTSRLDVSTGGGPIGVEGAKEFVGREMLNGREVEKWRITRPDNSIQEYWEDVRLHGTVRIVEAGVSLLEITNIREGKQRPEMFEVPSGYQEVARPEK